MRPRAPGGSAARGAIVQYQPQPGAHQARQTHAERDVRIQIVALHVVDLRAATVRGALLQVRLSALRPDAEKNEPRGAREPDGPHRERPTRAGRELGPR